VEEIAQGDLATALGASATTMIRVQPLSEVPTPDSVDDSVNKAIDRALEQRPDLQEDVAGIRRGKCSAAGGASRLLSKIGS